MTYADDLMIAAEDGPAIGPERTREEWDQLFATLDAAESMPTLAVLPDWSELSRSQSEPVFGDRCFDAIGTRPFSPNRDLTAALTDGRLTRAAWGTLAVDDPIVVAALTVAETAERLHVTYGAAFRCDACLTVGILGAVFDWAGALFVHLLTCPHFKRESE